MRTKRTFVAAVLVVLALLTLVAGCAKKAPEPIASPSPEATKPATMASPSPTATPKKTYTYTCMLGRSTKLDFSGAHVDVFFKEEVEKRTNGRVKVEIFPAGQIGNDVELMNKVEMNAVQGMGTGAMMVSRWTPWGDVFMLPFVFDTWDKAEKFATSGKLLDPIKEELRKHNVELVAVTLMGMMDIVSRSPVHTPTDMRGLKFRIQPTPIFKKMCQALGIECMPVPYTEVYTSLKQGIIDGVFNTPELVVIDRTIEVCPHITDSRHMAGFYIEVVNRDWLQGLPSDLRQAVLESWDTAAQKERERVRAREAEYLQKIEKMPEVELIRLSDEQRQAFKEKLMSLHGEVQKTTGVDYMRGLYSALGFTSQ